MTNNKNNQEKENLEKAMLMGREEIVKAAKAYAYKLASAKDALLCKFLIETDIHPTDLAIYQKELPGGGWKIYIDKK